MKNSQNIKYVKDVATGEGQRSASGPFRMKQENERRFVRLEISSPMSLKRLKDIEGGFEPGSDWHVIHGTILNISAGGVLTELDQAVSEGDVVSMHFTIQNVELGSQNRVRVVLLKTQQEKEISLNIDKQNRSHSFFLFTNISSALSQHQPGFILKNR